MKKATRQQLKSHNSRLVLKTIFDRQSVSRADIARITSLSKATVSDVVSGLLDDGLVAEVGTGVSAGGKPPTLLSVVDDARFLAGIDLAEEQLNGIITDMRGRIIHQATAPIGQRDGDAALELVYVFLDELVQATPHSLLGIGIGTPGLVDANAGVVRRAVNRDWRDLPLVDLLQERYDLPVYIANDGHAAALGEYIFGQGKHAADQIKGTGFSNVVVLKVGTGISAGIIVDGRLYHGDGSGAGEIGHIALGGGTRRCRCGNVGCLETQTNMRALLGNARELARRHPDCVLNQLAATPEAITSEVFFQAGKSDDPYMAQLIRDEGRLLALAASILVSVLNIERVVIAGVAAQLGRPLLEAICEELPHVALTSLVDQTQVTLTTLGSNIVAYGAAALLLSLELGLV
ncbi:MAG: ROK family transcriptional regulator [Caldilineaceae bacterium]|nr:ROK family transcriptional regulator [Caldilineaceae bacterium]